MADVVAVADEGERATSQIAEMLAQGEQVGERLAGVLMVGQRVHDRHRCGLRQLEQRVMREAAEHDPIHPSAQVAADVGGGLAAADADLVRPEVDGPAAEGGDADVERDARPEAGLLEQHRHLHVGQQLRDPTGRRCSRSEAARSSSRACTPRRGRATESRWRGGAPRAGSFAARADAVTCQDHGRVPSPAGDARSPVGVEHLGHLDPRDLLESVEREVARVGGEDEQLPDAGLPCVAQDRRTSISPMPRPWAASDTARDRARPRRRRSRGAPRCRPPRHRARSPGTCRSARRSRPACGTGGSRAARTAR